jgi:adenylylsulfate kinase
MKSEGFTVWFTGLPCSGKSTLSWMLQKLLSGNGLPVEILDGDEARQRLTKGLGFSKQDRDENVRRVAYVAKLLSRVGAVAIVSLVSPYRETRERVRKEIERFVEIHVRCPLEVCTKRDVKGQYAKALKGEIQNFTGISDPYEPPINPEIVLDTDQNSPEECLKKIHDKLVSLNYLRDQSVGINSTPEQPVPQSPRPR